MSILEKIAITNPTTPIWIGGDLNLPNIDWSMGTVFNNCYPLALCNIVLDFIADHGFSQLVHTPTRNNNILDIFFTNQSSLTKSCEVIPGISDHEIVSISTSVTIPNSKSTARNILLLHRADFELINHQIAQFTAFFMNTHDSNTLLFNGETCTDSAAKANILNNQFVSVFTKDDHSILPIMRGNPIPDIEQLSIGINGVYNLLVNSDPHKATGPDGIPSRLLKETAYQMAPLLTFIFQSSLQASF